MEADGDDGMALVDSGDGAAGAGTVADAGDGRKERCGDSLWQPGGCAVRLTGVCAGREAGGSPVAVRCA